MLLSVGGLGTMVALSTGALVLLVMRRKRLQQQQTARTIADLAYEARVQWTSQNNANMLSARAAPAAPGIQNSPPGPIATLAAPQVAANYQGQAAPPVQSHYQAAPFSPPSQMNHVPASSAPPIQEQASEQKHVPPPQASAHPYSTVLSAALAGEGDLRTQTMGTIAQVPQAPDIEQEQTGTERSAPFVLPPDLQQDPFLEALRRQAQAGIYTIPSTE